MKNVLSKLRWKFLILDMRIKMIWYNISKPFKIAYETIKRYRQLRAIDQESKDGWERYLKKKELENQDQLKLRRSGFFLLKSKIISAFFMASISLIVFVVSKEHPEETTDENALESSRMEFMKNKKELCKLVDEIKSYDEISFSTEIEENIQKWEFEDFKTSAELESWQTEFAEYITSLDII